MIFFYKLNAKLKRLYWIILHNFIILMYAFVFSFSAILFYKNDIKIILIDFKYFYNVCNFFVHRSVKCKHPLNCKATHFACLCESGKKINNFNFKN